MTGLQNVNKMRRSAAFALIFGLTYFVNDTLYAPDYIAKYREWLKKKDIVVETDDLGKEITGYGEYIPFEYEQRNPDVIRSRSHEELDSMKRVLEEKHGCNIRSSILVNPEMGPITTHTTIRHEYLHDILTREGRPATQAQTVRVNGSWGELDFPAIPARAPGAPKDELDLIYDEVYIRLNQAKDFQRREAEILARLGDTAEARELIEKLPSLDNEDIGMLNWNYKRAIEKAESLKLKDLQRASRSIDLPTKNCFGKKMVGAGVDVAKGAGLNAVFAIPGFFDTAASAMNADVEYPWLESAVVTAVDASTIVPLNIDGMAQNHHWIQENARALDYVPGRGYYNQRDRKYYRNGPSGFEEEGQTFDVFISRLPEMMKDAVTFMGK